MSLNPNATPFTSEKFNKKDEVIMQKKVPLPDGLLEAIAKVDDATAKNDLGNLLYPLVYANAQPELAGKITGMLIKNDVKLLLHWLQYPNELQNAINSALNVIKPPEKVSIKSETLVKNRKNEATEMSKQVEITKTKPSKVANVRKEDPCDHSSSYQSGTLWIRHLHPSYSVQSLHDFFELKHQLVPPVSSIRICREQRCAFIHFLSAQDAFQAFVEVGGEFGASEGDLILESDL